jgi:hypothetical protein
MGGACSAYGGREEADTGVWWGNLRERDHLGDPDIDGRIILRWIFRIRALIRSSVIIFLIVCKVQLSAYFYSV